LTKITEELCPDSEEEKQPVDKVKNFISKIENKWNELFLPGTKIA